MLSGIRGLLNPDMEDSDRGEDGAGMVHAHFIGSLQG